ncbi:MAG: hypothetical protein AB8B55_23545 [Mariniblastus sp.]
MKSADSADVELELLIKLFFDDPAELGRFEVVSAEDVTEPARSLLAHDHHMTVTVEKHHGTNVDVKVLQSRTDGQHYSRKILLTRQSDGGVVQYGIVRLNMAVLLPEVSEEILKMETPLGRILINHNVLRSVKLVSLLKIKAEAELAGTFGLEAGDMIYGRTALIYCDGSPAIELLEIVV